ncbi:MAG: YraN family protein [Lentisphaeria bacterium]|nr:YraN family protein [Lentisphaeria bacterium]
MNFFARAKAKHIKLGSRGENFAVKLYRKRNAVILCRNWRNSTAHDGSGELDIVLLDGETLVFAEVKTRRKLDNYLPGANLSDKQKKHIRRGAKTFCRMKHISKAVNKRFDLVEVIYDGKRLQDIALHENYMPFSDPEFLTEN